MYCEVIKPYVPMLGKLGTKRNIPDGEAQVHILLGNVKQVEREQRLPRRIYRRKDMTPEPASIVVVDVPEVVEEPEEPAEKKTRSKTKTKKAD